MEGGGEAGEVTSKESTITNDNSKKDLFNQADLIRLLSFLWEYFYGGCDLC